MNGMPSGLGLTRRKHSFGFTSKSSHLSSGVAKRLASTFSVPNTSRQKHKSCNLDFAHSPCHRTLTAWALVPRELLVPISWIVTKQRITWLSFPLTGSHNDELGGTTLHFGWSLSP
jgi:hypothetical protein